MKRNSVVFNQNKEQVKNLVKECVRHADESIKEELKHLDSKRPRKEFHYLKEIIFGICDGDNKSNNTQIENVFYTRFYSYENYLLNPINLYLVLKHVLLNYPNDSNDPKDQLITDIEESAPDLKKISSSDLLNRVDLLQFILDQITEKVVKCANEKISDLFILINGNDLEYKNENDPIKKKEKEMAKEFKNLYLDLFYKESKVSIKKFLEPTVENKKIKLLKLKNKDEDDKEEVKFIAKNEITLKMSKFLCYMKGKHLQYFYESDDRLFGRLRTKLQKITKMKNTDPFSRLILSYMKNNSSECLFLIHNELSEEIFSKF